VQGIIRHAIQSRSNDKYQSERAALLRRLFIYTFPIETIKCWAFLLKAVSKCAFGAGKRDAAYFVL
jgi:hypothetical protein